MAEETEAKTIRGYWVNAENATAEVVEFADRLSEYYRMLGCDMFDIATRFIDGHEFLFFVDDMGLLRDSPKVTAIDTRREPALVGNLVVVARDENDPAEVRGLTDEEVEVLRAHTQYCMVHCCGDADAYTIRLIDGISYYQIEE